MTIGRQIRTQRLLLEPISWRDMRDVAHLKSSVESFGRMLGGVRQSSQIEAEMAEDLAFWVRRRLGIFAIRKEKLFVGITGFHERPDGRGLALRFALDRSAMGHGYAREAAGAALRYAFDAGEKRVIGVTREDNTSARVVLGRIGMHLIDRFERDGYGMLVYESTA